MSKVVQLKARNPDRAHRIRSLLKDREKAEAEIAALLREQLDELGETDWLTWCDEEFGWARTSAYKHLNPTLMERARSARREERQRSHRVDVDQSPESNDADEEDPVEDASNHRTSFLLRAEQAIRFATYSGRASKEIIATARSVADAWSQLADKLENS